MYKNNIKILLVLFIMGLLILESNNLSNGTQSVVSLTDLNIAFADDAENDCPGSAPSMYYTCENGVWRLMQKLVEVDCNMSCPVWYCTSVCIHKNKVCENDQNGTTGCEAVPHSGSHKCSNNHVWQ